MMDTKGSILGNRVLRREDTSLLQGGDRFLADLATEATLHVKFVRSPVAHGELVGIDTTEAARMPGVVGVFTAADLDLDPFLLLPLLPAEFARPPVARDRVRFVGEIVAVVVAESVAEAADASDLVFADIEAVEPVLDAREALGPAAPTLFEEAGTNICFEAEIGPPDDPTAGAHHVVELEMKSQRLAGVPIEPNGALAIPEGEELTLWVPSQNPVALRSTIARELGIDRRLLRVVAPTVGGGFGSKANVYVEFVIVCALARLHGRPVRWVETRSENMTAMTQGRAQSIRARLGLTTEGHITGLDVDLVADTGAYPVIGALLITFTLHMMQGVYAIPALRFRGRAVTTNTTSIAAYRGAGRPEATQLLERIIDVAAVELDLDPAEIRRMNFLAPADFPVTTLTGASYDTGEYEQALDKVLELAGYAQLREEQMRRRASGEGHQLGIGIATYVEVTAPFNLHAGYGSVEIELDGRVTARVGTSAHGQGHVTSFSMILSDLLGVPMENIAVLQSDTAEIPRGIGTMGSRSLQIAGSALHQAGGAVLAKARSIASHLLEADDADFVVAVGGLQVVGVPAAFVSWAELAAASHDDRRRPEGMDPGLSHEADFDSGDATYPFGAHVSVVEVDIETGAVEIIRHIALDDCGRILNPLLVAGQQHGGIAQGIAQALFESVEYDGSGNPLTATLAEYGIPSAADLPSFEAHTTETPTPRNPLGAKGIGESGTIGSTPAVHNAVIDAVSHLGVRHIEMPLSGLRVWQAINRAGRLHDEQGR